MDRSKLNDQQVRARTRPHPPQQQQQPQQPSQPSPQPFYPAPPRPQPFTHQPPSFDPYNQSHQVPPNSDPQSPSTTVNFGNGFVQNSFSSSNGVQPNVSRSHSNVPITNRFNSNSNGSSYNPPTNSFSTQQIPNPQIPRQPSNTSSHQVPVQNQNAQFYNIQSQPYQNQPQFQPNLNNAQDPAPTYSQGINQHSNQHQPQLQPQPPQQPQQPNTGPVPSAVPLMMAGLQHMAGATNSQPVNHAALGAHILNTLAPGAAGYTDQIFGGDGREKVKSFMKMPKYYFAVNHRYVLRKLSLILMPFMNRTWSRQRGIDTGNFDGSSGDDGTCYLPPRDDVNAPDLYIPVMSFVTYVLVVGFVFGTRNAFKAEVLANYFSRGLGVLTFEVLIIKLLLYLINARPTPWLDVIAYRGYKFVGVVLTIVLGLIFPRMYVPALIYSATAMGIFLMRSHRRIILPRDMESRETQDLARRNAFLLFVCVLQFPIYWILARVLYVEGG